MRFALSFPFSRRRAVACEEPSDFRFLWKVRFFVKVKFVVRCAGEVESFCGLVEDLDCSFS